LEEVGRLTVETVRILRLVLGPFKTASFRWRSSNSVCFGAEGGYERASSSDWYSVCSAHCGPDRPRRDRPLGLLQVPQLVRRRLPRAHEVARGVPRVEEWPGCRLRVAVGKGGMGGREFWVWVEVGRVVRDGWMGCGQPSATVRARWISEGSGRGGGLAGAR
jgi:hypothetical protein